MGERIDVLDVLAREQRWFTTAERRNDLFAASDAVRELTAAIKHLRAVADSTCIKAADAEILALHHAWARVDEAMFNAGATP